MRILIITQTIDVDDPVLGFFCRWVEEFAKRRENVEVICLKMGKSDFPKNVRVHSLGKPSSRFRYIWNFYKHIFSLKYDSVFAHMNQEYILLGGWFWRLSGRKVFLWRNHAKGDLFTRLAVFLSNKVFYTSPQSFTARFGKALQMPVGIDTDFFNPNPLVLKKPNSILFLGRIAPVKNVDIFIDALNELQKLGAEFSAAIAGSALPKDAEYEELVRNKVSEYDLTGKVQFIGPVKQNEALKLYQEYELYVNLTPSGSMDKTIFEAMSCGMAPLVFNHDLGIILGPNFAVTKLDASGIAEKMMSILANKNKSSFRNFVIETHSLKKLVAKLENEL